VRHDLADVDRLQLGTVADLGTSDGDVAFAVPVDLDRGFWVRRVLDRPPALQPFTGAGPDDP
jgi:hypothetical protein